MSIESVRLGEGRIDAKAERGYLETSDISELLNVSRSTVHYFIRTGKLVADSGSQIKSQRKKIAVEEFKRFLVNNTKYYVRMFGENPQQEEMVLVEKEALELNEDASTVIETLMNKMELIESVMKRNNDTIEKLTEENKKLSEQRLALEKVIDML